MRFENLEIGDIFTFGSYNCSAKKFDDDDNKDKNLDLSSVEFTKVSETQAIVNSSIVPCRITFSLRRLVVKVN